MIRNPKSRLWFRLAFLLLLNLVWGSAAGAMSINRAVITFTPDGAAREDVVVSNPGEQALYIDVQVLDVLKPGTEDEERNVVKDPEAIGLIATPRRLRVPAGGQRVVRLVNLNGHGDREQVYRINLKPMSGPVESEQMGVRVLVGYQLLVFVQPRDVNVDLKAERNGRELVLHNQGNVNVRLHQGEQCPPAPVQDDECREVDGLRLYPGNRKVLELPRDAPVRFSVSAAGDSRKRRFD
jgi:P pilus assembly chaperone PapD